MAGAVAGCLDFVDCAGETGPNGGRCCVTHADCQTVPALVCYACDNVAFNPVDPTYECIPITAANGISGDCPDECTWCNDGSCDHKGLCGDDVVGGGLFGECDGTTAGAGTGQMDCHPSDDGCFDWDDGSAEGEAMCESSVGSCPSDEHSFDGLFTFEAGTSECCEDDADEFFSWCRASTVASYHIDWNRCSHSTSSFINTLCFYFHRHTPGETPHCHCDFTMDWLWAALCCKGYAVF